MSKCYYREHNDLGLSRTVSWLAKWYGDTDDLLVEQVSIECPEISGLARSDLQLLDRLQARNQSALHSYLKFAAWKWLERESAHPDTIEPEVMCYSPVEELHKGVVFRDCNGKPFEIDKPQILYDNAEGFPLDFGHVIRIDLHAFDIGVEVGGTQPFNLLTPLLDGMVDESVWLPFPWGKTPRDYIRNPCAFGSAFGYRIKFRD